MPIKMSVSQVLRAAGASLCLGCSAPGMALTDADESGVFVHLFEWSWADVADECEGWLSDKGYAAVQVSPPQESISGSQWWTRYQPVSYDIAGRSGNEAAFDDMVSRCNAVGVDIYVDMVINHMSAEKDGSGQAIDYPDVPYDGSLDFHNWSCSSINYGNRDQVQFCDLVGLNDLKTESSYVRGKIEDYFDALVAKGVHGFRIDAAKHMPATDVAAIVGAVDGSPYVFQEVIGAPGEAVQPSEYTGIADVTEFGYQYWMDYYFGVQGQSFSGLQTEIGNLMSSDSAVVFTDNHDTSRNTGNDLSYKYGDLYTVANIFMLAYPYGYPKVMSSYQWTDADAGPPSSGPNSGDACFTGNWQCEHRYRNIANMVQFRKTAAGEAVANWNDINSQAIAFGRGDKAFVVINKGGSAISPNLYTGLPDGTYCDIANADYVDGDCDDEGSAGPTVTVTSGYASFSVASLGATAIHVDAVVGGGGGGCDFSTLYLRGSFNSWASEPMSCSGSHEWTASITFGAGATFKFDRYADWSSNYGDTNADGIADAGGSNITVATAGTYSVTFNDSTLAYSLSCTAGACLGGGGNVDITFQCDNGTTYGGQSVYVVGNTAQFGNWDPAGGQILGSSAYPSWSGTFSVAQGSTPIEWKCVKREEANATAGVVWESGSNNSVTPNSSQTTYGSF